jgi:hypothetical protein
MGRKTELTSFKFLDYKSAKGIKATTLVELTVVIIVASIMVLSFYSLLSFSQQQVVGSDRRSKVQTSLAYCLEHMSKYVPMASAIECPYDGKGFRVRIDSGLLQVAPTLPTPTNSNDDVWISYALNANTLSTSCTVIGTGTCGAFGSGEDLTNNKRIVAGFSNTVLPAAPGNGFYVYVDPTDYNSVDIGLVGLYDTSKPYSWTTRLTNPKVAMKTRLTCNNFATH